MIEITFTEEEAAEFTAINRAAVDHIMVKAQKEPNVDISPCWLCMSVEARSQAREDLVSYLNEQMRPIVPITLETATKAVERTPGIQHSITMWKKAELAHKKEREGGNPRAYFME